MLNILVIDDSLFQRRFIRKVLEGLGHTVTEAHHGEMALELLKAENFDFITTDLMMPIMGGLEFLEQLQKLALGIPTIVISTDRTQTTKDRTLKLGALGYIEKPVEGQEDLLHSLIQEHSQKVAS